MCMTPISLPNPYYNCGGIGLNYLHNTQDTHILVPCGKCPQCLSNRQGFVNQRVQMESFRSHLYMMTLTYNDESLPRTDMLDYKIPYPNYKDVQNMFKRIRLKGYVFRYMIVSEYGSKNKRPHFHAIIAIPKVNGDIFERRLFEHQYSKIFLSEWRRNVGCNKYPKWIKLCDYVSNRRGRTYDFHEIIPVSGHDNDVSFYLTKYLLKYDNRTEKLLYKINHDDRLFNCQAKELISLLKPRMVISKDFGSYKIPEVSTHINKGLSLNNDIPQFVDVNTGRTMLLSPYYRRHLLSLEWKKQQYERLSIAKDKFSFELENTDSILDSAHKSDKVKRLQDLGKRVKSLCNSKF